MIHQVFKTLLTVVIFQFSFYNLYADVSKTSTKGYVTRKSMRSDTSTKGKVLTLNDPELQKKIDGALENIVKNGSIDYSQIPGAKAIIDKIPMLEALKDSANNVISVIEKGKRFITTISKGALLSLPQGILLKNPNHPDGNSVTIGIASATMYPAYTQLKVYVKIVIKTPNNPAAKEKVLFFGSDQLKLNQEGGFIGDANLVLLGDYNIDLGSYDLLIKGGLDQATNEFEKKTYCSIDCNGFKELKLTSQLLFPTDILVGIDGKGDVIQPLKQVTADISTIVKNIDDILFEVSLPSFAVASAPDWGFNVQSAVFDFSNTNNSPNMQFPDNYIKKYFPVAPNGSPSIQQWKGLFVKTVTVFLPQEFKKKNSDPESREKITADNMIIDDRGVSGLFTKNNIIALNEGDASGWDYSVDAISLEFETNKLVGGAFKGVVEVPISKSKDCQFTYDAVIPSSGNMALKIGLKDDIPFDAFRGFLQLDTKTSYIKFESLRRKFVVTANFSGEMNICVKNIGTGAPATTKEERDNATFKSPKMAFRNLKITGDDTQPWISLEYLGYSGLLQLGKFPAAIEDFGMGLKTDECYLRFGLRIGMMENNFSATTFLKFNGEIIDRKIKMGPLTLEGIKLNKIKVFKEFELDGSIQINETRTEKGWSGSLAFKKSGSPSMTLAAIAASFGYNSEKKFRYWYVGASTGGGDGSKAGFLKIGHVVMALYDNCKPNGVIKDAGDGRVTPIKDYKGFRGVLGLNTPAFQGDGGLEISISPAGGISRIGIIGGLNIGATGDGASVAQLEDKQTNQTGANSEKKSTPEPGSSIAKKTFAGRLNLLCDLDAEIFHGDCDFYVNIGSMVKGKGENGCAGRIEMHYENKENHPRFPGKKVWYNYFGTPDKRINVTTKIIGYDFTTGFYLMTGYGLPPGPPLPAFYQKALGYSKSNKYKSPDYGNVSEGTLGSAFGANFDYDEEKKLGLGIVYAYYGYSLGFGFDFLTRDCSLNGKPGCGGRKFFNSAQAYIYLEGRAGVGVNLWIFKAKIELLNAGIGALIRADSPSPSGGCADLILFYKIWKYKGSYPIGCRFGQLCESCAGQDLRCPTDNIK